jgi:hypothetical protein
MTWGEALAEMLGNAIDATDLRQYEVAAAVEITPKHLNAMLRGRAGVDLDLADAILHACGRRLVVGTEPIVNRPTCTTLEAAWCPVHGDCTCSREDSRCPLHDLSSDHAEAERV